MPEPGCLFCRIATGEVPSEVVRETGATLAFRDIAPAAPTHVLVIPREHHRDLAELATRDPGALVDLVGVAAQVARSEGLESYRLVFNTGRPQQDVMHAHGHVLGGRRLDWPPG